MKKRNFVIDIDCPFCGKSHTVAVAEDDFDEWMNGKLAQDAFPYLNSEEREQLISGLCPECQNKMFGLA